MKLQLTLCRLLFQKKKRRGGGGGGEVLFWLVAVMVVFLAWRSPGGVRVRPMP